MNVLEQLLAIDPKHLVRVCVDGIYHTQVNVELKNVFRTKHELRFENLAGLSFVDQARKRDLCPPVDPPRVHYGKELHLGGGGCGKTYVNLTDGGLVRPLYLAPSWKLSRAKQNETEELGRPINGSVWNQALSADPEKVNRIRKYYNTLVIDEISMLSEADKQKFFRVYADMKIIMCGDLGYQLPCISQNLGDIEATKDGFDNIELHTTNHRCECPILAAI